MSIPVRELKKRFHLPLDEAAKQLDVTEKELLDICKTYNINFWPYKKLKELGIKILETKKSMGLPSFEEGFGKYINN